MKAIMLRTLMPMAFLFTMLSCSSDSSDEGNLPNGNSALVENYDYNPTELELMRIINEHRQSINLPVLQPINHISYKSEEHNEYMIENNVVNHAYFEERSQNLVQVLGAVKVNENVAYSFNTPQAALQAWLESPSHKANIEGDFTHFGISVRISPETGRKYYTNMFIKK
ncbi:CAP domain-containing protein [Flavobacterium microcysteis]|uniref:CAP domain-containing protein n=1 Tax=Flavobacterium microcysteis TaxID=2596891 RepID=A0A501QFH0_9FLAO|nr:CAP domain-containing protein [Flavobacterium microcysteis]TPD71353.1 CAP domain-containing protein [Flavobacterium microcysteis]